MTAKRSKGRRVALAAAAIGLATIAGAAIVLRTEIILTVAVLKASFFGHTEADIPLDNPNDPFSAEGVKKIQPPIGLDAKTASKMPRCYSFDLDGDAAEEVLVEWDERPDERSKQIYHFQVLEKSPLGYFRSISRFEIPEDMAHARLRLAPQPGTGRPPQAILEFQGGSTWGTMYLLRPDGQGADRVTAAADMEALDLDGDGANEWLCKQWHDAKGRLRSGCKAAYRELWSVSGGRYRQVWPGQGGPPFEIASQLEDFDGDGRMEIIALFDPVKETDRARKLAVLKLRGGKLEALAATAVVRADSDAPFDILEPIRKNGVWRISLVRWPADGLASETEDYEYRDGGLTFAER